MHADILSVGGQSANETKGKASLFTLNDAKFLSILMIYGAKRIEIENDE